MAIKSLSQKEIAEKLGVSSATVSLVLRDPETNRASAETKQRILQYAPATRQRGRNGSKQKSAKQTTVLFVMRGDEKRFFFQQSMLHGAQEQAAKSELKLEVVNPHQDLSGLLQVDYIKGVLLESPTIRDSSSVGRLVERFPTVALNAHYHGDPAGMAIQEDTFGGFHKALEHVVSMGHRRIGYLGVHSLPGDRDPRLLQRLVAFTSVARFMGIELAEDAVQTVPNNRNEAIDRSPEIGEIVRRWRDSKNRPTVVLCHNDLMAARVIMIGLASGLRVPEDLSLVGYDNESLCTTLTPRLTSICPRFSEMGRIAVSTLCSSLIADSEVEPCKIVVPAALALRDSVIPVSGQ